MFLLLMNGQPILSLYLKLWNGETIGSNQQSIINGFFTTSGEFYFRIVYLNTVLIVNTTLVDCYKTTAILRYM